MTSLYHSAEYMHLQHSPGPGVPFYIGRCLVHKRISYSGGHQDVFPPSDNHANNRAQFS